MQPQKTQTSSVFAPAKINLYLHITGKRSDGYHLLDSMICFTDIGDTIVLQESDHFTFQVEGPFARSFQAADKDAGRGSSNLVVKAIWALSDIVDRQPNFRLTLKKNTPLGGGIGGGSSDAAATLWALSEWWNLPPYASYMNSLMLELGTDVPACYSCNTTRIQGVGEHLKEAPEIPELPILLVHPAKPCFTKDVYQTFKGAFQDDISIPEDFVSTQDFIDFLKTTSNDLIEAAIACVPEISVVLDKLDTQDGALITRMSGSGSTCFSLFENEGSCFQAAENIIRNHPQWWVRTGTIGRPVRY